MPPKKSRRVRSPTPPPVPRERSITPVMPENLRGIRVPSPSPSRGRGRGRGRNMPTVVVPAPANDDEMEEMDDNEPVVPPPPRQNKKPSDKEKIKNARENSENEYDSYMTQGSKWKLLEFKENQATEDLYKRWAIPLDAYSISSNIADY